MDYTDPHAVLKQITGKTRRELQIELARAVWGPTFDDVFAFVEDRRLGFKKALPSLIARINNVIEPKYGITTTSLDDDWNHWNNYQLTELFIRENFPLESADLVDRFINTIDQQQVPLFDSIVSAIEFGIAPLTIMQLPNAVLLATGKSDLRLQIEQARKGWDEPRIPYPFDTAYGIMTSRLQNERVAAVLDMINQDLAVKLVRLPERLYQDIMKMPIQAFLPNVHPSLDWDSAANVVSDFINSQQPEESKRIREDLQARALSALKLRNFL
jgi:hypothetical protein